MASKGVVLGALAAAVLVGGGWIIAAVDGAGEPEAQAQAPAAAAPAPSVPVAEVVSRTLPETAQFTGRLAAVDHVELRPRVGGYLGAVRFREGSLVRRGDVLFELDARPAAAAVARATAQLHQAQERRALAERKAARAQRLRGDDVISQAELEGLTAEHAESTAAVEAARAWLRAASIELADTKVRAPIDGRVGQALVTRGNLVSAGATLLTTIVSVDPLHVTFDVDEATYRRFADARREGVAVQVRLAGDTGPARTAKLDYVANQLDPRTGTARARAVLPNPDGTLAAGLFARVTLETGAPRPVVLVRDEAIATGPQGRFVLVVTAGDVVEARAIQLGETVDGLRVVTSGLRPGDRVILKGLVRPGMTVAPQLVPMVEG